MRIVSGRFRGRSIPFQAKCLGGIRVTSGKVKGAAFSMLGEDLTGRRFLDLCGGSGQVGLEAFSRGATVTINEPDRRRLAFIRDQVTGLGLEDQVELTGSPAQELIPDLVAAGASFDFVYVDPPYGDVVNETPLAAVLLEILGMSNLVCPDGAVLVQYGKQVEVPAEAGCLEPYRHKTYGDTQLSVFVPWARD